MNARVRQMQALAAPLWLALVLAGCQDPALDTLEQRLDRKVQAATPTGSLTLPQVPDQQPLAYRFSERRSPFVASQSSTDAEASRSSNQALAPDAQRSPQPLEQFSLDALRLVGILKMGNRRQAVIRTPTGEVVTVSRGDYMGQDFGKITRIRSARVILDERIFHTGQGWSTRTAVLSLESGDSDHLNTAKDT